MFFIGLKGGGGGWLQIKNFMLTRLLVNHLQVNIAYMKIWV